MGICPYCFGKFEDKEVLFRANTGFTQEELDREEFASGEVDEHKRLFVKFSQKNPDEKLDQYWRSRGGSGGYASADPRWNMPHIDPADGHFREMLDPDAKGVDEDGFVRDRDGFIARVYDRYSDCTLPMTRLCPHCHNPLPLVNYGKYPTMFISVVGITTCGKTVYLNQLLNRLATAMQNTGYYITENNLPDFKENVEVDTPLPGSTDDSVMRRPLAVNLVCNGDRGNAFTIVFYDIAGENCVRWGDDYERAGGDQDMRNRRAKEGIASFIARADGLMFLIDPNQVPGFAQYPDANSVRTVVRVVNNIRVALNMDITAWADVPVAVVLTKTDEIKNQYQKQDSPLFLPSAETEDGLNRQDYFAISTELEQYLSINAATILADLEQFSKKSFCGVSAITCGVERRFAKYRNWYILDEVCDRKFDELRRWINGWNDRTPEDRAHYYACPIRQIASFDPETHKPAVDPGTLEPELRPIEVDRQTPITEEIASNILTEIYADCAEYGDRIYLTMWEVWQQINLVGYPKGSPNPRRVEDPLKWILWRLGKIGPYFREEPEPTKGWLESSRRFQDRFNDWIARQIVKKKEFYEGEDLL